MHEQLEIEFFWPLTEQIELDLDYTGCVPISYAMQYPKVTVSTFGAPEYTWTYTNIK